MESIAAVTVSDESIDSYPNCAGRVNGSEFAVSVKVTGRTAGNRDMPSPN